MKNTVMIWIQTARPKTLLVSAAPVLMGGALALHDGLFHVLSFVAALLGALCIQIGTNYANDYFDAKQGADTSRRLGPKRALQEGLVSSSQMRAAYLAAFACATLFGCYLVYRGGWPIVLIGVLSLLLGVMYTATRFSLAYLGIADIFVLLFFGPIAVAGTYYVQTLQWNMVAILAGFSPGLLSTAVLVVNNLRDAPQDKQVGKKTLAVRCGQTFAKYQYAVLVLLASLIPMGLWFFEAFSASVLLACAVFIPALSLVRQVFAYKNPQALNLVLAKTGQLTLLFAVLFSVGVLW